MTEPTTTRPTGLGLIGATSLAITIVVGSGALILPGIAYRDVGRDALWAWVLAAALALPLLVVLGRLGRALPDAAGVTGYLRAALGARAAAGAELLLMGTFMFGIPGIALAGGHYLAAAAGLPASLGAAGALVLMALAAVLNCLGTRLSGAVQSVLCVVLVAALLFIALCGTFLGEVSDPLPDVSAQALHLGLSGVGTVFFAFTGWELVSFTTREYARPKRDFPLVLALSYLVVVALYCLIAIAVQSTLPADTAHVDLRPMELVVDTLFGATAAQSMAMVSTVLLLASVLGNFWAASRLVASSAEEGLLPARLAAVNRFGVPHRAIVLCALAFGAVIVANGTGHVSIAGALELAGKNFLLLYLLCCVAHIRLFPGVLDRTLGLGSAALLAIPLLTFEPISLLWAAFLLTAGFFLGGRARVSEKSPVKDRMLR
ncbi:APC family permease [Streptomyces sp. NPDC058486]|uniref:APC family permease n=1 Tax=unclassified Streptomyces TaxID=2593676 RepID=UPI00365EF395